MPGGRPRGRRQLLWLYLNNRNIVGSGQPVLTGPARIDKTNIDSIAELAKNGSR
jgi:simple sugar transport system substrate-binding protein